MQFLFKFTLHWWWDLSVCQQNRDYKFKVKENISSYNFFLGSASQEYTADEQSEISLNSVMYVFQLTIVKIK